MTLNEEALRESLTGELETLWAAHRAVGLDGFMRLYTLNAQDPWRAKEAALSFWFGANDTKAAVDFVLQHYRGGKLPNSSLLLNPIVHRQIGNQSYQPVGSGVAWATALCLGVETIGAQSQARLQGVGAACGRFRRGDSEQAGVKALFFADRALQPMQNGQMAEGCRELFDLANVHSDAYFYFYLLSGVAYLATHGLYQQESFGSMFPAVSGGAEAAAKGARAGIGRLHDAAHCWNAYDRHHALYAKFGVDREGLQRNLALFSLAGKDIELFNAIGPMHESGTEKMGFAVEGLLPRGSVTLLAGSGGSGRSSLAHHLAVIAATDPAPGAEPSRWLGQEVKPEDCKGITVYFSGEDGPAIINARARVFDPDQRAGRVMYLRTDFGQGVTFSHFLKRLHKLPSVPLLIVDPTRKYLEGSDEDPIAVNRFFDALEEFAASRNAAVLALHHLQKGARPRQMRDIADMLGGTQSFADRARVVIGIILEGPYAVVGLAKNSIPPHLGMITEERVFARNPSTLQLHWLPGAEGIRVSHLSAQELEKLEKSSGGRRRGDGE